MNDKSVFEEFESGEWVKCIYMGIPFWGRQDENNEEGLEVRGFFVYLLFYIPFTGEVMIYEGSYLRGLWIWLTKNWNE